MKKILLTLLLLCILLPAAALGLSRLMQERERAAAAEALNLLQRGPLVQSEGGDALMLLAYQADAATRRQWLQQYGHNALILKDESLPENVRAAALSASTDKLNCLPMGENGQANPNHCLYNVRADLPDFRAAAAEHAPLLANADALSQYDSLEYRVNDWIKDSFPPFTIVVRQDSAAALAWAEGRHQEALTRACRNIQTGRTLLRGKGMLIDQMIGNAVFARNSELLAHMLAERPEFANRLPENCAAALAPFAAGEPNTCAAIRSEFYWQQKLYRELDDIALAQTDLQSGESSAAPWLERRLFGIALYSPEHTLALAARQLAYPCTEAARQARIADRQPAAPSAQTIPALAARPACWLNMTGCILVNTAAPEYGGYAERLQDTAMQQRAVLAALAVYRLPENQRRAKLNDILTEHAGPARQLTYDAAAKRITFPRYSTRPNDPVRDIPLTLP